MNLDEALPGFVAESGDLLREMEAGLLQCSGPNTDPETINLIFRSAHTIKGSAGLFGLDAVVAFVHVMETALLPRPRNAASSRMDALSATAGRRRTAAAALAV
jgi:two-component system chemotaxis sensor kinase CheA